MPFFEKLLELVNYFFSGSLQMLGEMATGANPVLLVLVLLVVTGWLGAACWAAEIAEAARLSPYTHFWIGLAVPFFYAVQMKQKYQPKPDAGPDAAVVAAEAMARVNAATGGAVSDAQADEGNLEITMDAIGFRRLKRAGLISPASPCYITYGTSKVRVSNLLDALDACAVVEVDNVASGQKSRLRIPYGQIKALTFEE